MLTMQIFASRYFSWIVIMHKEERKYKCIMLHDSLKCLRKRNKWFRIAKNDSCRHTMNWPGWWYASFLKSSSFKLKGCFVDKCFEL
jgi:hypothetical protein